MKILTLVLTLTFPLLVHAEMLRVVGIQDGRTLLVERNGAREPVVLAGIAILDELRATEGLRWTAGNSWVLIERHPGGGHLVWRSPDALFLNRELVERGWARATAYGIAPQPGVMVTYLGQVNPAGPAPTARPGTGSDTSRRSTVAPKRDTRARRSAPSRRAPRPRPRKNGPGS